MGEPASWRPPAHANPTVPPAPLRSSYSDSTEPAPLFGLKAMMAKCQRNSYLSN